MSKITIDRSLLEQAIDALEKERPYLGPMPSKTGVAITALREALETNNTGVSAKAQPQQEPVPPELFAQQIAAAMRFADAPLSEVQAVTLVLYLKALGDGGTDND